MRQYFEISALERASFDGGFYRYAQIEPPNRLVRFSDSSRGRSGRLGRFWMYGAEVAEILEGGPGALSFLKEISNRWAVCDDWGDMGRTWVLHIPNGFAVAAWFGKAKAQPQVSDPKRPVRKALPHRNFYDGGALQLIVPIVDENGEIDRLLHSWIVGPMFTSKVASSPKFVAA
jgi:hypothetical protein